MVSHQGSSVHCCIGYCHSDISAWPFQVLDILVLLAWMKQFFWINSNVNPLVMTYLRILFLFSILLLPFPSSIHLTCAVPETLLSLFILIFSLIPYNPCLLDEEIYCSDSGKRAFPGHTCDCHLQTSIGQNGMALLRTHLVC